jgi:SAM-dependent methyltransferase
MSAAPDNRDLILDQFTRQAAPFSVSPSIRDEAALRLIVECSGAGPKDTLLDVACGAGHVVCAFARTVRHATGIDLTPAMLEHGHITSSRYAPRISSPWRSRTRKAHRQPPRRDLLFRSREGASFKAGLGRQLPSGSARGVCCLRRR